MLPEERAREDVAGLCSAAATAHANARTRICPGRARARSSRRAANNLLPLLHVVLQPRPVMLPDKSTHEDAEDVAAPRSNAAAAHASARTRCRRCARSSRRAVDHLLLLLMHLLQLL